MNTYISYPFLWEIIFSKCFYMLIELMLTYKSATKLRIPMKRENKKWKSKKKRNKEIKKERRCEEKESERKKEEKEEKHTEQRISVLRKP